MWLQPTVILMKKLIAVWLQLKELEAEIAQDAGWIHYSTGMMDERKPISKRRAYVEAWYYHFRWLAQIMVCRFKGHKWVDDSSCGPDSGNMDHYCARCGHSIHYTLY